MALRVIDLSYYDGLKWEGVAKVNEIHCLTYNGDFKAWERELWQRRSIRVTVLPPMMVLMSEAWPGQSTRVISNLSYFPPAR